jgi:hypothetical protein
MNIGANKYNGGAAIADHLRLTTNTAAAGPRFDQGVIKA